MLDKFAEHTGTADRILSAYRSLDVKRYHTQGDIPCQNLADHSGRVALLQMSIWPNARPLVTQFCLIHDLGEKVTGDLPYTSKSMIPPEAMDAIDGVDEHFTRDFLGFTIDLESHEKAMVKVCDYLELMLYCLRFGNRGSTAIAKKGAQLIAVHGQRLLDEDRITLVSVLSGTFLNDILEENSHVGSELAIALHVLGEGRAGPSD